MCFEEIACPSCASRHLVKNGTTSNRKQKYLCRACRRQFIRDYSYQGCRPEIRSLIVPMTLNGSGVRDITRVLKVCINTVLKVLPEQASRTPEPELPLQVVDVKVDELWSFVQKKKNQRWLWYAFSPKSKQVIGYVRGRRTDTTCQQLLDKLAPCQITRFYTDRWESYEKLIPEHRHWIGKQGTQRIERNNLTISTRLKRWQRRTICFSKSEEMDDAVIKLMSARSPSRLKAFLH
ncbi:MAG TPA: IS1 family transposase [Pyrinomonadaceae bacterium]|nr:IS1 family transposase [Pyrinomonadaceae bacterium]